MGLVLLVTPVPSRGLFLMKCWPPEHSGGEVNTSAAAQLQKGLVEGEGDSGGVWQGRRSIATGAAFLSTSTALYCHPPANTLPSFSHPFY